MTENDDEGKLLTSMEVEGIENIEIGGDADGFKLYLERCDSSGVALSLTSKERDAIRDKFMVMDRINDEVDSE